MSRPRAPDYVERTLTLLYPSEPRQEGWRPRQARRAVSSTPSRHPSARLTSRWQLRDLRCQAQERGHGCLSAQDVRQVDHGRAPRQQGHGWRIQDQERRRQDHRHQEGDARRDPYALVSSVAAQSLTSSRCSRPLQYSGREPHVCTSPHRGVLELTTTESAGPFSLRTSRASSSPTVPPRTSTPCAF